MKRREMVIEECGGYRKLEFIFRQTQPYIGPTTSLISPPETLEEAYDF